MSKSPLIQFFLVLQVTGAIAYADAPHVPVSQIEIGTGVESAFEDSPGMSEVNLLLHVSFGGSRRTYSDRYSDTPFNPREYLAVRLTGNFAFNPAANSAAASVPYFEVEFTPWSALSSPRRLVYQYTTNARLPDGMPELPLRRVDIYRSRRDLPDNLRIIVNHAMVVAQRDLRLNEEVSVQLTGLQANIRRESTDSIVAGNGSQWQPYFNFIMSSMDLVFKKYAERIGTRDGETFDSLFSTGVPVGVGFGIDGIFRNGMRLRFQARTNARPAIAMGAYGLDGTEYDDHRWMTVDSDTQARLSLELRPALEAFVSFQHAHRWVRSFTDAVEDHTWSDSLNQLMVGVGYVH